MRISLYLCVFVVMNACVGYSQSKTGEIRIEVKDPLGKPMQASGKIEGQGTGATANFETNEEGLHTFPNLPFGRYRLELSRDGFATQSALIDVQSETPVLRSLTMAVGAAAYRVDVISATPLAGVDLLRTDIAAPVQTGTERDIEGSGAIDLSDFLNRRLDGVHLNEIQGNPFQANLNYRGYTASPLLGTPQGLSVYIDGVRFNQPFGDIVSWDLIPRNAISETTLMPGSNPVFGLNTLGGALSVQMKDGNKKRGTDVEISGGSFGRGTVDFEHGGSRKGLNWYLASSLFFEDGWRDNSPSNVRQFFGKLGWQNSKTVLNGSFAFANNSLTGNGPQEQRLLARDYKSIYTKPDITNNRSPFVILSGRRTLSNAVTVSGNMYYRRISTSTLNGDVNEDSLDQSLYQPGAAERTALAAAGYTGVPASGATAANTPFPFWRCLGNVLLRDEPGEKCNGLLNRSRSRQSNGGLSGQFTWFGAATGRHNQMTVGSAYDRSTSTFLQTTQIGYLAPDRSIIGAPAFADGVTGGNVDGVPFDARINLRGTINTGSVYATDTFSFAKDWSLTLSGRYNRTLIDNFDRITPLEGSGSLTGRHVFNRFNPAAGITYSPNRALNLYIGFSEASRAPTSIELGCADPEQPCKLPNAMSGDPPLKQVVARTWEAGVRGVEEGPVTWSFGAFRDDNRNDILFVQSGQTGLGYFKNFGKTRRQGFEIDMRSHVSRVVFGGGYTFLDATYRSEESVNGSGNSTNDAALSGVPGIDGAIEIEPGNRIPLTPQHMVKAFAEVRITSKLSADLGFKAFSDSFARGNENNLHRPDGVYYLGPGSSPGYSIFDLGSRYQVRKGVELFVQLNNLFNQRYYSAAQIGPTAFLENGNFIARPFPAIGSDFPVQHATFYAPGAPRGVWAGLRFSF